MNLCEYICGINPQNWKCWAQGVCIFFYFVAVISCVSSHLLGLCGGSQVDKGRQALPAGVHPLSRVKQTYNEHVLASAGTVSSMVASGRPTPLNGPLRGILMARPAALCLCDLVPSAATASSKQ